MHQLLSSSFWGITITFVVGLVLFFLLILARQIFCGGCIHDRANARLRELETRLNVLYNSTEKKSRRLLPWWLLERLPPAAAGLFKVVQIPYDIYCVYGKQELKADFKYTQLEAAEIYYVQGRKYGYKGLHKLPADPPHNLLLTQSQWISGRNEFIKKLDELAVNRRDEASNSIKDMSNEIREGKREIPYQSFQDYIVKKTWKDFFDTLVSEMVLGDIISSVIDSRV